MPEPEWIEIAEKFEKSGRTSLIIGTTDSGKTTFITWIINYFLEKGLTVAVVDGDVGQSSIGPPGTIGVGIAEGRIEKPEDIKPSLLYFTGSISPSRHLLQCTVGIKKMVDYAVSLPVDKILIDTTGMVIPYEGIALKTAKIELLRPDYIFAFYKDTELEPILSSFRHMTPYNIIEIKVSEQVKNKSPEFRASERKRKFLSYFHSSKKIKLKLKDLSIKGIPFLSTGRILNTSELRFISSSVDFPVDYGEKNGERLIICLSDLCEHENLNEVKTHFSVSDIIKIDPLYSIAGLIDINDEFISMGIINDFRPGNNMVELIVPFHTDREKIKKLHPGNYKLPEEIFEEINRRL